MTSVSNAPKETGLFLKSESGNSLTVDVPVIEFNSATVPGTNFLHPTTGEDIYNDGSNRYVFANKNAGLGFYHVTSSLSPAKGKAYLELSTAAPSLSIDLDGETTGIKVINLGYEEETINNDQMFDLQGRRITEPVNGMFIMNGKKYIVK